MNNSLFIMI